MFLFLIIRVLIGVNILCTIILYGPTQYLRREARLMVHWTLPYKMTLGRGGQNSKPFQIHITLKFLFLIIRVLIGVNILCTIILYGPTQYLRREARLMVHWTLPYKMTLGRGGQNSKPFQIHITLKFLFLIIRVLIGVNILCTIILYGPTQYMRREARLVVHWTLPYKMTLGRPSQN